MLKKAWNILLAGLAFVFVIFFYNKKNNNVEGEVRKSNEAIDKMSTPALVQLGNDIVRRNSNK